MPRFSLKWLLIVIAYIAVSMAALLNANTMWRDAIRCVTVVLLLTALLGAIWSSGTRRAFWGGYFLWGVLCLMWLASFIPFISVTSFLPTEMWESIHKHNFGPKSETFASTAEADAVVAEADIQKTARHGDGKVTLTMIRPKKSVFVAIGNAVLCIPFALLGGFLATLFYRRRVLPQ